MPKKKESYSHDMLKCSRVWLGLYGGGFCLMLTTKFLVDGRNDFVSTLVLDGNECLVTFGYSGILNGEALFRAKAISPMDDYNPYSPVPLVGLSGPHKKGSDLHA